MSSSFANKIWWVPTNKTAVATIVRVSVVTTCGAKPIGNPKWLSVERKVYKVQFNNPRICHLVKVHVGREKRQNEFQVIVRLRRRVLVREIGKESQGVSVHANRWVGKLEFTLFYFCTAAVCWPCPRPWRELSRSQLAGRAEGPGAARAADSPRIQWRYESRGSASPSTHIA